MSHNADGSVTLKYLSSKDLEEIDSHLKQVVLLIVEKQYDSYTANELAHDGALLDDITDELVHDLSQRLPKFIG